MSEKGKKLHPTVKKTTAKSKNKLKNHRSRRCSNARPLPTLTDLEKMFVDSDDSAFDINLNIPEVNNNQSSQGPYSHTIFKDMPDSPDSIESTECNIASPKPSNKTQQYNDELYTISSHSQSLKVCQPNIIFRNRSNYTIDLTNENGERNNTHKQNTSAESSNELTSNVNFEQNGNDSDSSIKTIIYDYDKHEKFSPLPSTSTDMETIRKNDDMLSNSIICLERRLSEENSFNYKDMLIGFNDKNNIEKPQPVPKKSASSDNEVELIEEQQELILIDDNTTNIDETKQTQAVNVEEKKKLEFFTSSTRDGITIIDVDEDYINNNHPDAKPINNVRRSYDVEIVSENPRFLKSIKPKRNVVRSIQCTQTLNNSDVINLVDMDWSPNPGTSRTLNSSTPIRNPNNDINICNAKYRNSTEFRNRSDGLIHTKEQNNSIIILESPIDNIPQTQKPKTGIGDCPICLESLVKNNIVSTLCGHLFCKKCIDAALKINRKCPTCRKSLNNRNSYHPIFL